MDTLEEPAARYDPHYDSSDEKKPANDSPLGKLTKDEMVNVDNFYEYDDTNQPYEPMVQPFSYFYVGVSG